MKNNVKKYRMASRLTLSDLAEKSGVPISTIADIEHGSEPRVFTALLIARALKVPVEKLWIL